jgi:hypothetical protein
MINIILGDVGSGKTTAMTWIGHDKYDDGYTLVSNLQLFNIPYIFIDEYTDLSTIEGESEESKLCFLLDEAYMLGLDARRSMSLSNLNTTKFGMQHRKKHADIYITSQTKEQIDKRFRSQCVYWFEPEITLKDEVGKPVLINLDFKRFNGKKTFSGTVPLPMQYEFEHGYVDVPESFDTYQKIEESTIDLEDAYGPLIEKYSQVAWNLKKGQLAAMLEVREKLPTAIANKIADYLKGCVAVQEMIDAQKQT